MEVWVRLHLMEELLRGPRNEKRELSFEISISLLGEVSLAAHGAE